jgi:hypothetical protein
MSAAPVRVAMNLLARSIAVALFVLTCATSSYAEPPVVSSLEVGVADQLQAGRWAPVIVTLDAAGEGFDGKVFLGAVDGDGVPYRIPASDDPIRIAKGASHRQLFHFRPAALDNELTLTFEEADGQSTTQSFRVSGDGGELDVPSAIPASERLIVSLGAPLGLIEALDNAGELGGSVARAVEIADLRALPEQSLGFDAIDTLFVATSDPAMNAAWAGDASRVRALTQWVRNGGRLVLTVGKEAATVLAPEHPLAQFVPGRYQEQVTLLDSQTAAWGKIASARQPLPLAAEDGGNERLRVPLVVDFRGKIEAPPELAAGQPPLIARAPFGLGEVVFVAADLDQAPFARWSGRVNLLRHLARLPFAGEGNQAPASRNEPQHDLAEQLQRAMDLFPGVRLAEFYWVALLVLGYIALIGPSDFKVLQRLGGRMSWTWLTFPALVLLTTFGAYRLAASLKGSDLRFNQVDVVDVDSAGNVRGTTIANVFSPKMATFDLAVMPAFTEKILVENPVGVISGFALQPAAIVGESERTAIAALSGESYQTTPANHRLVDLPIHIWSSKSIIAEWQGVAPQLVSGNLKRGAGNQLEGEIRLHRGMNLEDCWIVDGDFVARVGDWQGDDALAIGARAGTAWSTLATQLSYQRRVQKAPGKEEMGVVGTQWDPESTDVREIMRQILFYDAAGGANYTRSVNGVLRSLDLSARRDLGEVMVFGLLKANVKDATPGAKLYDGDGRLDGISDQHWTIVRCLVPVK